ncbi:MAG: hypothetical protein C0P72_011295, partial [Clostridia bacterium]
RHPRMSYPLKKQKLLHGKRWMWVQFEHFKNKKWLYFKVFGTLTDKVRKNKKRSVFEDGE